MALTTALGRIKVACSSMIPGGWTSSSSDNQDDRISQISNNELLQYLGIQQQPRKLLGGYIIAEESSKKKAPLSLMTKQEMTILVRENRVSFPHSWKREESFVQDCESSAVMSYSTHLDFTTCHNRSDDGVAKFLKEVPVPEGIISLQFDPDIPVTVKIVNKLCEMFPNLESVSFAHAREVDHLALGVLKGLKYLKHLDISSSDQITDACMAHVAMVPTLLGLNISGCRRITNDGFSCLISLKQIRWLQASWCAGITDVGLTTILRFKRLQHVELQGDFLVDATCVLLGNIKRLEYLDLGFCRQISEDGLLKLVTRCYELKFLSLRECFTGSSTDLLGLARLKKLERLDVGMIEGVDDKFLAGLHKVEALREINLDGCKKVSPTGLYSLKDLKITSLSLVNLDKAVTPTVIPALPENLTHLNLEGCYAIDQEATLKALIHLTHLEDLRLSNLKNVTVSVIKMWAALKNLRTLSLRRCVVIPETATAIETYLPQLETVDF